MRIFYGTNDSGVAYWRGKLPARKIMEKGLADVNMFSVSDTRPEDAPKLISQSDVVYVPCACGVEAVVEFLKYYQTGKATVADYDDNLFDCHPFNPGYSTLGLKECKLRLPDGREEYLWKDGRMGFSLKDNHIRHQSQVDVMMVASGLTTTTEALRDKITEQVDRPAEDIDIVPNSIDFNLFKPFSKRKRFGNKPRIGWTASDSHLLEGQLVNRILTELYRRRNDFEMVIVGNIEKFRKATEQFPIEWHPFCDINVYPLFVAGLELDIGICPLEEYSFNRCKSALKWSEYSAFSIPSVCSDLEPYRVLRPGTDGFLAKDHVEFVDRLEELLDDSAARKRIGAAAFERNHADYNLDKNVHKWIEVFQKALDSDSTRELSYKGRNIPRNAEVVNVA